MSDIKIGDTYSRYHDFGTKLETRVVTKVSDKSILFSDKSGNIYRVKNTGGHGYYMKDSATSDSKGFYVKD